MHWRGVETVAKIEVHCELGEASEQPTAGSRRPDALVSGGPMRPVHRVSNSMHTAFECTHHQNKLTD